ncbi:MFS transporter protein [Rutstroemia sp. NJR-2017a BVV2]|nr:MFS transporter protein [Rutstroemia sp. NJR-2017a BVV2]
MGLSETPRATKICRVNIRRICYQDIYRTYSTCEASLLSNSIVVTLKLKLIVCISPWLITSVGDGYSGPPPSSFLSTSITFSGSLTSDTAHIIGHSSHQLITDFSFNHIIRGKRSRSVGFLAKTRSIGARDRRLSYLHDLRSVSAIQRTHDTLMIILKQDICIYFQAVLEASPQQSGINTLAAAKPMVLFGIIGGIWIAKADHYKPNQVVRFAIAAIAIGYFSILDQNSPKTILFAGGAGVVLTTTPSAIQAPLPESDVASSTATWGFIQSLGFVVGVAVPSSVFEGRFRSVLWRIWDDKVREVLRINGAYEHASRSFIIPLPGATEVQVIATWNPGVDCLPHSSNYAFFVSISKYTPTAFHKSNGSILTLNQNSSHGQWIGFQILPAAGVAVIFAVTIPSTLAPLQEADVAVATANYSFVGSFGFLWGFTMAGTVFNGQINAYLHLMEDQQIQAMMRNGAAYTYAASGQGVDKIEDAVTREQVIDVYIRALRVIWLEIIAVALLGVLCVPWEKYIELRKSHSTEYGLETKEDKVNEADAGKDYDKDVETV